jgi:hypothetical protein
MVKINEAIFKYEQIKSFLLKGNCRMFILILIYQPFNLLSIFFLALFSIKTIMLKAKEQVIDYCNEGQNNFGDVESVTH